MRSAAHPMMAPVGLSVEIGGYIHVCPHEAGGHDIEDGESDDAVRVEGHPVCEACAAVVAEYDELDVLPALFANVGVCREDGVCELEHICSP